MGRPNRPVVNRPAQAAYWAPLRAHTADYEKVKKAILYRLEILPEHYHQRFRAKKKPEEQQPQLLAQALRDLLERWIQPEDRLVAKVWDIFTEIVYSILYGCNKIFARYIMRVTSSQYYLSSVPISLS